MSSENEDIFGVMGGEMDAPVPPPMELKFNPAPNFQQIIEFKRNPEAFNSYEAIERRYREGRVDIERKKASGAYGVGDSFDQEAYSTDFKNLNEALYKGMPARLFPAFMPYTAQEADMAAEVSFYGGVPTMEEQIVTQKTYGEDETDRMTRKAAPLEMGIDTLQEGIGSLLSRFGGDSDSMQFILAQEGRRPEIQFFREKGRQGMPDQAGIRFTRTFQPRR